MAVPRPLTGVLLGGFLAFGVLVYLFMNFVVLPLSAFPLKISYSPAVLLRGFSFYILLVSLPIALSVSRFSFARPEGFRA